MNIKAGKTKCMVFGTSQKIKNKEFNIAYHHQSISEASTYKYLGLTLDQTLKGYLCSKTIFCNKVALDVQLMNFFLKKKCFVLKIFRFLCFCEIHRFQNL